MASLNDSQLTGLTELDYFQGVPIQTSIIDSYTREVNAQIPNKDNSPIEFFLRGAPFTYVDLNNSKIMFKVKITNMDGKDIAGNAEVAPVNLLLHSLFKSVDMHIQGKSVTDATTMYSYRSYIETITNYDRNILETRMLSEGWLKDKAGKMNLTAGENTGIVERGRGYANSVTKTLIGRPHLDLFHQERLIPPNLDLFFSFVPNDNKWLLKTPPPGGNDPQPGFKLEIVSAKMYFAMKAISPSLQLAHMKMLEQSNYRFPYNRVTTRTLAIGNGITAVSKDNLFEGHLPDMIIAGIVADEDMHGGYQMNPYNFQNLNLKSFALKVNGTLIPRLGYKPDFETGDYIREYTTALEALGYDIGPTNWDLTPYEWANGYNLYAFKITPGPNGGVKSLPQSGSIQAELEFGTKTGRSYTLILLAEQRGEIQIDKNKNVLVVL